MFAAIATGVFYIHLVALTRLAGKRSLAQMTTFDFVTNVSIGSVLPAAIVTRGIAFWTGLAVLSTLFLLQYGTTWMASRSRRVESLITNPPRLLYFRGYIDGALKAERLSKQQFHSKLREQGYARLEDIDAVVMETSGGLAVLQNASDGGPLLDALIPAQFAQPRQEGPGA